MMEEGLSKNVTDIGCQQATTTRSQLEVHFQVHLCEKPISPKWSTVCTFFFERARSIFIHIKDSER